MSQLLLPGHFQEFPFINRDSSAVSGSITLNAAGERCHMVGYMFLENPLGGSKTISQAGGGFIVWRTGTSTFANASTTFKVGIQDVSTASSPSQGDGTFDVQGSYAGNSGAITSSATQASAMTTGTKTIAHGALVSVTFEMTARGGTDSVVVLCNSSGLGTPDTSLLPAVTDNTSGSVVRSSMLPNLYIVFDDGSLGWIFGAGFSISLGTAQTFNVNTGTADEYGNIINVPCTFVANGVSVVMSFASNAADCELILYSNPFGTPVAERIVTIDATQISASATVDKVSALFSSPYNMRANTNYAVSIRPTTTNNVTTYYSDAHSETGGKTGYPNSNCYAARRVDAGGAFSDYNSFTAKTRLMYITLIGSRMEQGVNSGNYRIGI